MKLDEVRIFLGDDWKSTMNLMSSSLKSDIGLLNMTNMSLLSHNGKCIRPIMSLLVARMCSGGHVTSDGISFAAASELLHNATLFHDDVADESAERRGRPTVMSILGGPASVLLGDYWLVKAMGIILDANNNKTRVIRLFADTLSDLAAGEMLQLEKADHGDATENDYLRIIYNKTASLFIATCLSAAISAGASEEKLESIRKFSKNIGLAFQIKDDILDYDGDEAIGKPLGQDILEQKITLPLLGAFYNSGKDEEMRIRRKIGRAHV